MTKITEKVDEQKSKKMAKVLGANIKEMRLNLRYSQHAFAQLIGISKVTLGSLERGESNPNIKQLVSIASLVNKELIIKWD